MVYFGGKISAKLAFEGYPCDIEASPKEYLPNQVSFGFQTGSPYVELFNHKILMMRESGQVGKIIDKYLRAKDVASCDSSAFKEIKFPNVFTAFLVLAVGIVAAWVGWIYEMFRMRRK